MLSIKRFTVEALAHGCVTDQERPRFSFSLESDREQVSLRRATLALNGWQIETKSQIAIPYQGAPLKPFTTYQAELSTEDDAGECAQATLAFETGRMGTAWAGEWITDQFYRFTEKKTSPIPMTFRKRFTCEKPIAKARIYITALGVYELALNGKKVGEDYFAPGLTSYKNTLQYQCYDLTDALHAQNELCVVVGGGWAVGAFTMNRVNRITAPRQALLAELRITFVDGSEQIFGTDETWQVTEEGNLRYGDFFDGEVYDARVDLEQVNWKSAALETVRVQPKLLATYGSLVRAHEVMHPVSCTRSKSGMLIYDFGQNFAGVIRFTLRAKEGDVVTFQHAELLMDGELFLEPLRTAKVTVSYTCTGGEQSYSPRLTYMGFRYVGVRGVEAENLELSAYVLHSDMEEIGQFHCSNELVNRLQQNILWSARSNFMDIPTDCPQRDERMGWTGDIALFAPTACYNFDTRRFLEKWLADVKAEQRPGGGINVVIPEQGFKYPPAVVAYWGDCCILVPWAMYQAYGDAEILREMYPVMKKYLGAVKFWAGLAIGHTRRRTWRFFHQYGDWVAPDTKMWACMNRGYWTATACWSNSCNLMSQIAQILGETDDQRYYYNLKQEIDEAYETRFLDETGKMKALKGPMSRHALGKAKEFQSGYVLPIAFEMLTPEKKRGALEHLVRLIQQNDYRIGTGFPGTPYILFALADNGLEEEAFRMLMQDRCPSWLYEAKAGGTTIWERWDALREDGTCNTGADDGTNGMTSFNHYASGAVGSFLYRRVAGIEPTEPGYQRFRVKPLIGGGLTQARGSIESPYGTIVSDWEIKDGAFQIHVVVPVNTTCSLVMPSGQEHTLGSGSYTLSERGA